MSVIDNPIKADAVADDATVRFPSLAAQRAAHGDLLKRHRAVGTTPELLAEAEAFIRRGRKTGAVLDVEDDRWACQGLLDYWSTLLYRAGREPPDATLDEFDPTLAPELDDALCPYMGLDAFREDNDQMFFGREQLVDKLVGWFNGWLKEDRLLTVVGPSGSGKSSLVRAGVIPALKAGAVRGSENWRYYPPLVPGSHPLKALAWLTQPPEVEAEDWTPSQVERFQQDPNHLAELLGASSDAPAVLVIDQFEEVFTLCQDDAIRQAFVDNLLGLIRLPNAGHTVILTMRTDFEPHVARLPDLQPFFERALRVTPLSTAELREAIEQPAALVGLKFEEGVVDALIKDILGEPAALPLLQFTLLKLWENRVRNRVTWEAYNRLGGGREALARSADELYQRLIHQEQEAIRYILLRMVRPGEGLEVTSNRVRRDLLYQASIASDRIDRGLERLIEEARLVRLTEGDTPADAQVELAHEALVRNWPRLVDWVEDERETMRQRLRLTADAEQWRGKGKHPDTLLRGALLAEAMRYTDLSDLETEFVQASQLAQSKEAAQQRRIARLKVAALGTISALIIGILLALYMGESQLAQQRELAAATAQALAGEADSARATAEAAATAEAKARQTAEKASAKLLVETGRRHAEDRLYDDALDALHQAKNLDPNLDLDPEAEVAEVLVEHGRADANKGAYDGALTALLRARDLDPTLELNPEAEVAVAQGQAYARKGETDEALAALRRAMDLDPQIERSRASVVANIYNAVCQQGSLDGVTEDARDACERAVTLAIATDDAYLNFQVCRNRNTRGLGEIVRPSCERADVLAREIPVGETATGEIETGGGDLWKFHGTVGQVVTVAMHDDDNSGLDTYLILLGPDRAVLAENDDSVDTDAVIENYVLLETGPYTIVASGYGDSSGAYELTLNRESLSDAQVAEVLVEQGREHAAFGEYDQALATLRRAQQLDPSLDLVPEAELAQALVEQGRERAAFGDYDQALATLRRAQQLDPSLDLVPEAEVALAQGRAYARLGEIEEALAAFRRSMNLDPTLELNPEAEVAQALVEQGREHAAFGDYDDALAALREAMNLDPQVERRRASDVANLYNAVCQQGSLDSLDEVTEELLDVCERAVKLAVATDDAYLNFQVCRNRTTRGLGEIVQPSCERAEELTSGISVGETATGGIETGGGDLWGFNGTVGQVVTVAMNDDDNSGLDTYLILLGPDGAVLAENDDSVDTDAVIENYVLPETGKYTIVARGFSDESAGAYTLALFEGTE